MQINVKQYTAIYMSLYGISNLEDISKKILKIVGSLLLVSFAFIAVSQMPFMKPVLSRFDDIFEMLQGNGKRGLNDAWIRFAYVDLGIQIFKQHPILGIGIANANIYTQLYYGHDHYLHNNFVELLACGGVVGFIIYYSMHLYLLANFWRCKKHFDAEYRLCFLLLIINLIVDYGLVSYYDPVKYIMLYIMWKKIKYTKTCVLYMKADVRRPLTL